MVEKQQINPDRILTCNGQINNNKIQAIAKKNMASANFIDIKRRLKKIISEFGINL